MSISVIISRFSKPFIALCLLFIATIGNTKPIVVSSIKPVELIVAAVADTLIESQLLLPASVSPHLYHLRPSDQKRLRSADLIVWVGPELERFLVKPLALMNQAQIIDLTAVTGRDYQFSNSEHLFETAAQDGEYNHTDKDPHIWLDPLLAAQLAQVIANKLSAIDPENSDKYRYNWIHFSRRIKNIDNAIREQLQPVKESRYIVLHDAYGYFERRYGLQHAAALTISPDHKPGVRHLMNVDEQIKLQNVRCVFREPQYQSTFERMVIDELPNVKVGLLDPLALDVPVSAVGYEQFILAFSAKFKRCLMP